MTDHAVALPALDGRDQLGFLAALGLLRLLADEGADVRLSFSDQNAAATLHGPYRTMDAIVDAVWAVVSRIPSDGLIPGVPAGYPSAKSGTKGSDPIRTPREDFAAKLASVRDQYGEEAARWHAALVTDLGVDNAGRVALTPYCAPSGQQSVRSFFEKPTSVVRTSRDWIVQALVQWRRQDGFTGEYLDHRAIRSAVDLPSGVSNEAGVPGATWLAIMALPILRLAGDGTNSTATLWQRRRFMVWPIWHLALDLAGVVALIEHPSFASSCRPGADGVLEASSQQWPALGVFAVSAARRQRIEGRNFAGVLAPLPVRIVDQRGSGAGTRPRQQ